jgi:transglutaminase-like putative cysteine protease
MRLLIEHETRYRYETPVKYFIQQLRLTPPTGFAQHVLQWTINAPDKLDASIDAYGNVMHTLVLTRPTEEIVLDVYGEIETTQLTQGQLNEGAGRLPLEHFTCATPLTQAVEPVRELAQSVGPLDTPSTLVQLAEAICGRVAYESGVTNVFSTAGEALELGHGVCQDHAHLMLACCRSRGLPARYVSGYLDPGEVPHAASHAWVDVWLGAYGWVSVDVTHARFASGSYCRIAIGRDYDTAAPVRGTRIGGGAEEMHVAVHVGPQVEQ